MPLAIPDALRSEWTESRARALLYTHGYHPYRTNDWMKPTADHVPTQKEYEAFSFLWFTYGKGRLLPC